MKLLNLGCGTHYSSKSEWTNLDFSSTGEGVIAHNLLRGIPFANDYFDMVYHSHVLEHFAKEDGENMVAECFRVLKPGGILRIAVPDLEMIVRNYLKFLDAGIQNPDDKMIKENYDWMMLEMYDQTVRNESGGNMAKYLCREILPNEKFVFDRLGEEGKSIRNSFLLNQKTNSNDKQTQHSFKSGLKNILSAIKKTKNNLINTITEEDVEAYEIGKFRTGGEIHQWMYDRYSLTVLLAAQRGTNIKTRDAFTSYLDNRASYNLDGINNVVRKPDSLFMEAIKK